MSNYTWTKHSEYKMNHYRLSKGLIKRIIRYPARIEEGILEDAIACMKPVNSTGLVLKSGYFKKYSEIWAMYCLVQERGNSKFKTRNSKQIKIITAWRYPGKSPERNPVPEEILQEARRVLGFKDEP